MPTASITLPDGTSWVLTWDATSASSVPSTTAGPVTADLSMPESTPPTTSSVAPEVKEALARVPPKWAATFMRFVKTLIAGMVAAVGVAWATTGGTIEGMARDPQAFLVAIGTAALMALQKAVAWKDQ